MLLIASSISIIRENLSFYLFLAVLVLGLTVISYSGFLTGSIGVTMVFLWQLLARFVTRSAISGVKFTERNPDGSTDNVIDGFILKAIALAAVSLVIAFPFMLVAFWNQVLASENPSADVLFSILVIVFVSYGVVLGVAGSWLPASLHGPNRGLSEAIRRAPKTFLPVIIRVLPVLLIGVGGQILVLTVGQGDPVASVILSAVAILIQCVTVTLVSVILAHYYLRYEALAAVTPVRVA
jgi:hypothetical protein